MKLNSQILKDFFQIKKLKSTESRYWETTSNSNLNSLKRNQTTKNENSSKTNQTLNKLWSSKKKILKNFKKNFWLFKSKSKNLKTPKKCS